MLPSEYALKHFLFSAIREPLGARQDMPWDNLMWGSDFPHSVGTFPNSTAWRKIIFENVPEPAIKKVTLTNPARFFGLDLEKDLTETPGALVSSQRR